MTFLPTFPTERSISEVVRVQVDPTIFVKAPAYAALQTETVRFVVYSKGSAHLRVAAQHKLPEETRNRFH